MTMNETLLRDVLFIPCHQQRNLSTDRVVCLVHEEWLSSLKYAQKVKDVGKSRVIDRDDATLLLAPSNKRLPKHWSKICIKLVQKSDKLVSQLNNGPLYSSKPITSCLDHLTQAARENFRNLWAAAHVKFRPHSHETVPVKEQFTNVMRSLLQRFGPAVYIHHQRQDVDTCPSQGSRFSSLDKHPMDNIVQILAVIETDSTFFIVQPYIKCSLQDMVNYSPTILATAHAKSLFILYQILQAMASLHARGITFGELTMHNIRIDERLWVKCSLPLSTNQLQASSSTTDLNCHDTEASSENTVTSFNITDRLSDRSEQVSICDRNEQLGSSMNNSRFKKLSECEHFVAEAVSIMEQFNRLDIEIEDLAKVTEDWQMHRMSNFKYLMVLNHLAGRKLGDPNHHPVLPWVIDFSGASTGYRDLSMSKFRLNKGDSQLDFTYEAMSGMSGGSGEHIPHHVSDVLSDITYYVYKARRTPKHILCAYVRSKWVPNEYPQSIERMYHWTPDECIPEFFTDPTIFSSIHEDLPDLELPSWCTSSAELISRHMEVLESEQVSCRLHHWIDLTFGYKLSGAAAVKAKNVYLKLVDDHKTMVNHGVVQLFVQPHPNRLAPDKILSALPPRVRSTKARAVSVSSTSSTGERESARPDSSKIKLPDDFDPTADLDHLEALSSFVCRTAECLPPSLKQVNIPEVRFSDLHQQMCHVWSDMQQFGCLMCEMYLAPKLTTQRPQATLRERYNMIGQIYGKDNCSLPRMVQTAANILLHLDKQTDLRASADCISPSLLFEYPMVTSLGTQPPTPALLLQPYTGILPFPSYFDQLYNNIVEMKEVDIEIDQELSDMNKSRLEKQKIEKLLSRKKVELLEKYLQKNRFQIPPDGYELILPYIKELFEDPKTTVQAAWALLGLVGKSLGPQQLSETLLPYLSQLFIGENTSPKHMKLYHRSFVVQLLMHVGLEMFLTHFCTLLVEAVAGYKDFNVDASGDISQEDIDDEVEDDEGDAADEFMFLRDQNVLDGKETVGGLQEDNTEEAEDIRPDQTEDDVDAGCGVDANFDDEEEEEEEQNLSNSSLSYTPESLSTDQVSTRSAESDQLTEEMFADHWSSDHGSLHSISHILPVTEEPLPGDGEENDSDTFDQKHSHSLSVHFKDINFRIDQSEDTKDDEDDQSNNSDVKVGSNMIRSETDEFRQIHYSHTINICDVAAETLKWLSHRLGPLLSAKYLSKNLVRMLALCYLGEEQTVQIPENEKFLLSTRLVQGDSNALKVLECLNYIAGIYGEQVVLIQYLRCIVDLIQVARRRLTVRAEAGLLAAVVLLRHIVPLLSDKTFLEILKEYIVKEVLIPLLRLLTSLTAIFPSGPTVRSVILYKFVDILYVLGLRLGFEMTRLHLTPVLADFFKPFGDIYSSMKEELMSGRDNVLTSSYSQTAENSPVDESYLNIKMDDVTKQYMIGSPVRADGADTVKKWRACKANYSLSDSHVLEEKEEYTETRPATEERAQLELQQTFSAELALAAYIPLTSVFGSHHMEEALPSDDLIRKLCSKFDKALYTGNGVPDTDTSTTTNEDTETDEGSGFGSNVEIVGNRICLQTDDLGVSPETSQLRRHFRHKGILRLDPDDTKCSDINRNKHRHLKGNWLAYCEHELGLNERDTMFNFKQIKLQTFLGHNNSVRSLTCLDNENSFISSSKDKTVKLWSLTSFGDGSGRCREQFTYCQHKKSVFSVAYLQNLRLVASCDSTVHIWDPFTGDSIRQLESNRYSPVIVLTPLPTPSSLIMTATTDNTLRFLDLRTCKYAHEYKCVIGTAGLIKCAAVSPDGSWIAVGFSTGNISLLNLHTGLLYGTWKGHDGEILQIKAVDKKSFLSTAFDLSMKLWSTEGREVCALKGYTEPVHCLGFYKNQVLGATTSNKIGVHSACDSQASFTSTKLQSEVFKGVLTCMAVLPLNRTLLLGADNGLIRLLC